MTRKIKYLYRALISKLTLNHVAMKYSLIALLFFTFSTSFYVPNHEKPEISVRISAEELKLYDLIMEYRKSKNLPTIPLSKSLTYVAQQHCLDLEVNLKSLSHSWSTCKYNSSNSKTYECMWLKPREMTAYQGYGYECAHGVSGGYPANATDALEGWKKSPPHNAVILSRGIWKSHPWNAIGIGIHGSYACIWFGEETDTEGAPEK